MSSHAPCEQQSLSPRWDHIQSFSACYATANQAKRVGSECLADALMQQAPATPPWGCAPR